RRAVVEVNQVARIRERLIREVHEDFPFRSALADPATGDLGGEVDAPFRRRLGASATLFVPGLRREQQDRLLGVDEHLTRDDEILMDSEGNAGERRAHILASWAAPV